MGRIAWDIKIENKKDWQNCGGRPHDILQAESLFIL